MEGGAACLKKDKGKGPRAGKTRISDEVRLAIVKRTALGSTNLIAPTVITSSDAQ